jgi:uncharacterized protein (DUF1697 family)
MKMDALRAVYESIGLRDPQTYVQSGNVVFKAREQNLGALAKEIEDAIERAFGFGADVILRTPPELREVLAKNPFATRRGIDPAKLLVTFLASDPGEEAREKIRQIQAEPEELWIEGRELFIYFANGLARPKLSIPLIERTLKTSGTGRNWNSVRKLLEMAEKMES